MATDIPFYPYQFYFRCVEPVVTVIASCLAGMPSVYLSQLKYVFNAASAPISSPHSSYKNSTEVAVSLYQLANIYLVFALLGRALLKSSTTKRTCKVYLACFLFGDIGHIVTMHPLAEDGLLGAFSRIGEWNVAGWGMMGYLAVVMVIRVSFLLNVGMMGNNEGGKAKIGRSHAGGRASVSTDDDDNGSKMGDSNPVIYRIFFLYVEPISALVGAVFAALPARYLSTISPLKNAFASHTISIDYTPTTLLPAEVTVALLQLSNMYLMFGLIERFVLALSPSRKTWRAVLTCFLVADFGHLASMYPLGVGVFYNVSEWNAMAWGSVGFVYLGATMRTAYLLGIGLDDAGRLRSGDGVGSQSSLDGKGLTSSLGRKKGAGK